MTFVVLSITGLLLFLVPVLRAALLAAYKKILHLCIQQMHFIQSNSHFLLGVRLARFLNHTTINPECHSLPLPLGIRLGQ